MRRVVVTAALLLLASACAADDPVPQADLSASADLGAGVADSCQWPTFGRTAERSFRSCETDISTDNVDDLRPVWFFNTEDVVSASPVVVDQRLFVGDWAGVVYAVDAETGTEQWRRQMPLNPQQYGGQISGSVAYAADRSQPAVIVAAGDTVYALDPNDGQEIWAQPVTNDGFGEVLGSPLLAGNLVIVGFDAHGAPLRSGVLALDIETGAELWHFDPEKGQRNGCGGVWGTPTFDQDLGFVFFGTANCPTSQGGWNEFSEALIAVHADTGEPVWSFQPHDENERDADFAGAPNLFATSDGRALVGLGNKDANYYAVDRATGELVWSTMATEDGYIRPNFASGGFIGPAAVGDGIIVGATAVGQCPCLHAFDADTGTVRWQQLAVEPSYAPTTIVGDLAFVASIDTLLRAVDIDTGDVVWSHSLGVLASGGIAAIGQDIWAVAGFREPGSAGPSANSGVFRFSVDPDAAITYESPGAESAPVAGRGPVRLVDAEGDCIDAPCEFTFGIKDPPAGTAPQLTMTLRSDPFEISVTSSGLGDPSAWIREGSEAAGVGAVGFGVMISERDDDPNGGFLCVLDNGGSCTGDSVPNPGASYNRISVLAIASADEVPAVADGFARLVDTIAFSPPLKTELVDGENVATDDVVFSGQGNDLVAYALDGRRQLVIQNANDDPVAGRDINGQFCFLDDRTFIAGEDTGQPDVPPGWGIFSLSGDGIGNFAAEQIGKLVPTYQPAESQPEMFGCGVLADGRIVLTDVGNQASGAPTGQLMMFYPPDRAAGISSFVGEITDHCKLDISIATAQQIAIDDNDVLVAAARGPGVSRYTNLPKTLADCAVAVDRELFINPADGALGITNGIVQAPTGGWYVSSVFTGVINEYDTEGRFVREILRPPENQTFGRAPFTTGTPNGLTVTADGTLWYADLAIVLSDNGNIGPGNELGTVRAIRFVDGEPQPPEIIDRGLRFPDSVSVIP